MIIKYTFADDKVSEIEVKEDIGNFIIDSRRKEHADNSKQSYYGVFSLDAVKYEGLEFAVKESDEPEGLSEQERKNVRETFSQLTEIQQRRLKMYADGKTLRQIAELENASFQSVHESIEAAKKKFIKLYRKTP